MFGENALLMNPIADRTEPNIEIQRQPKTFIKGPATIPKMNIVRG